jgi:uncharacterized glyoxalase superfamily protein PhnB
MMPATTLFQLNLTAADVDATIGFYRLIGLKIPERTIWRTESGAHRCLVSSGGVNIVFNSVALAKRFNQAHRKKSGGSVVISFELKTRKAVDAAYERATAAGHRGLQPPFDAFWGSRYAIVEDPDGVQVGLRSPADERYASDGPEL